MRRHYLIISIICFIIGAYTLTLLSATGTPSTLVVRTDANNSLVVVGATQVAPITQGVFTSRVLRTDSSGNLQVIIGSGPISPTSVSLPASTCAAPALNEQGATTTGIAFTATPSILQCIAGTAVGTLTGSSYTLTVPILEANGSAGAPSYSFASQTTKGMWSSISDTLSFGVNGVERVRIDTSGAGMTLAATFPLSWGSSGMSAADVSLSRAAAKLLNSDSSIQVTRGTITTDLPVRTDTVTWNAAGVTFTGWKLVVTDTASAAGSLFLDLQTLAGGSLFKVAKTGLVSSNAGYQLTSVTVDSATAPTIASGGCTSPAIQTNGTAGIKVTIGTSCTGVKTIVLTFPTAAHFWSCNGNNITSDAAQQTNYPVFLATSTTSVTLTSYDRVLGTQEDFTASDIYLFNCRAE